MAGMSARLIHVSPVSPVLVRGVRAVEVGPEQVMFVGNTAFNLEDAQNDPMSEAMAILADGRVIGFYRLDFAPNTVLGHNLGALTVGVRAFALDRSQQGNGYGARAMIAAARDVQVRYPDYRLMILAVNCRNRLAFASYRRAGFIDTGQFIPGGRAGPQHVMLRFIPRADAADEPITPASVTADLSS